LCKKSPPSLTSTSPLLAHPPAHLSWQWTFFHLEANWEMFYILSRMFKITRFLKKIYYVRIMTLKLISCLTKKSLFERSRECRAPECTLESRKMSPSLLLTAKVFPVLSLDPFLVRVILLCSWVGVLEVQHVCLFALQFKHKILGDEHWNGQWETSVGQ